MLLTGSFDLVISSLMGHCLVLLPEDTFDYLIW